MENALAKFNPAALAGILGKEELLVVNDPFSGGISGGEFLPQISIRGNRFRLKIGGEETVLKESSIEVYLVTSRPNISKTFYADGYNPSAENKAPDCSSADGTYPDANVEKPVAANCQVCPHNAWGSKISKVTGKKSKACNDYKLIVLSLAVAPDSAFAMRIPAASLKPFASYISKLNLAGVPANAARTRITLGDTEYPSLEFDFVDTVKSREEYITLTELAESSDVLAAVKIQSRAQIEQTAPVTAHQPVAVAEVAPAVAPTIEAAPEVEEAAPSEPSLADLIGKKPAAKKRATKKEPAAEPAPAPVAEATPAQEEGGEAITSLDQLLGKLKK
jgi:hypothetical protein